MSCCIESRQLPINEFPSGAAGLCPALSAYGHAGDGQPTEQEDPDRTADDAEVESVVGRILAGSEPVQYVLGTPSGFTGGEGGECFVQ